MLVRNGRRRSRQVGILIRGLDLLCKFGKNYGNERGQYCSFTPAWSLTRSLFTVLHRRSYYMHPTSAFSMRSGLLLSDLIHSLRPLFSALIPQPQRRPHTGSQLTMSDKNIYGKHHGRLHHQLPSNRHRSHRNHRPHNLHQLLLRRVSHFRQ